MDGKENDFSILPDFVDDLYKSKILLFTFVSILLLTILICCKSNFPLNNFI